MRIIIASTNENKVAEFNIILRNKLPQHIEYDSLSSYPLIKDIEENGKSFLENAKIKAFYTAKTTGLYSLADDSGLVVDILDGEPGIYSARYASKNYEKNVPMEENIQYLLRKLHNVPQNLRTARYVCALAFSSPCQKYYVTAEASWEGSIALNSVQKNGFGYDSIFICNKYNERVSEISSAEKNNISHRKKALNNIIPLMKKILIT
ncbi:MAG: RdgB/HAM1 family non-canonical purine NTP pyrophosphatase [Desulfovibrionaceae bacterium]